MSSTEFNKYTNSSEFKELLERYEKVVDSGELVYFDSDDLIDIAEYYHAKGELEKAENTALYCQKLYPADSAPRLFRARMALIDAGDAVKAKLIMEDVSEEKESLESIYVKAEIMLCDDGERETERYLNEKYKQLQNNAAVFDRQNDDEEENVMPDFALDIAMMYCDHGCFNLSERWLKRVRKPEDDFAFEYYDTWTRIYVSQGRFEMAEETVNKQIDMDSFNVNAWLMLCDIQYQQAHYQDALQSAEYAMAISPNDAESHLTRGNCFYALNRLEDAEKEFERYSELAPDDILADLLLATTQFCRRNNEGAYKHCKKVYENIEELQPFQQLEGLRLCATVAAKVADTGFAEKCCERMRELDIPEEEISIVKGSICMEMMELQKAVAYFNEAVTESDYNIEVVARIGIICYEAGALPYAYRLLKESVDGSKDFDYYGAPPRSLAFLAGACRALGKKDEYLHYLKYAVMQMPLEASSVLGDYFPVGTEPRDYLEIEKKRMGM